MVKNVMKFHRLLRGRIMVKLWLNRVSIYRSPSVIIIKILILR